MNILSYFPFCCIITFTWLLSVPFAAGTDSLIDKNEILFRNSRSSIGVNSVLKSNDKLLIDDEECSDLRTYCMHIKNFDDLSILECVQTLQSSQIEALSDTCQHSIWNHTKNILKDEVVRQYTNKPCAKHESKLATCINSVNTGFAVYLGCLIEKLENSNDLDLCKVTIQRLESVAFSNYRLVGHLIDDCGSEINKFQCGRLPAEKEKVPQGETIACLQNHVDELNLVCKKRILKIAQQQAENLKLDHQFFLACDTDSQHFCSTEHPGTWAVFKCLLKHKNSPELTANCREQIVRRDKLLAHDYRVSRGLTKACKEDIRINRCRRGVSEDKNVRLAQILLCLESVSKNGTKISEECRIEINDHRRMLMMDFHLSPEILSGCSDDIPKFCSDTDILQNTAGGEIIHCLMDHARQKRRRDGKITSTCRRAIEQLVKVSDVGEDWRVDPVLRRACKPVVDVACRETDGGDARVMSCLMEHTGTEVMTPECEQALMLIQYFIARDFKLDPQLYRHCKDDAIKYCRAKKSWDDANDMQMDPERGPLILPCLHRIAYSDDKKISLKKDCHKEVERVMRQRAISVDLIPEVEDKCLDELAAYCHDKTERGAEMLCLQDNLDNLHPICKEAVSSYTEDEAGFVALNPVIMTVCQGAMKTHCDHILKRGNDEGDIMDCLISHKNDADLRQDNKCRAAIEHFQIISLKNYHFTYKFKEACRPYVTRFCSASTTKDDVVACLSEVMRNDTIRGQRHSIQKDCRQQVKAQLYQQRESIILDPKLDKACKKDILQYCRNAQGPGQALECLQTNNLQLSELCSQTLFKIKKSEFEDSSTDYTLVNTCKEMTFKYCQKTDPSKLLECLKTYKDDPLFDPRCHLVVVNRLIEQNTDFRFNPSLQLACGKNINQYCSNIIAAAKPNGELYGEVFKCLKGKFREARLEQQCEQKMIEIMQEQALNYKLNPLLKVFCQSEIEVFCKPNNEIEEHGMVEECLKTAFLNQKIINPTCKIEVATMIADAKADIHVDPLLHAACTKDLLKYCSNVKSGDSRQLKCLQTLLQHEGKAMEEDCRIKLQSRIEMFRNADTVLAEPPENVKQLVQQVVSSPSYIYFLIMFMAFVALIFMVAFVLGLYSDRVRLRKRE